MYPSLKWVYLGSSPRRPARRLRLVVEPLESRVVPSGADLGAVPAAQLAAVTNPTPVGFTPAQIRTAYGFNSIAFLGGNTANAGAGQTIAIVDVYDDPNIAGDLHAFDQAFGLADPPSFKKVNENGSATGPFPRTD